MKRVLFYTTLLFAVLLCRTPTAEALTYGVTYYRQHLDQSGTGSPGDPLRLFINEVETTIAGGGGVASLVFTPGTAPSTASEGEVYYNDSGNTLNLYTGSSWVTIDTAGASSLSTSYGVGSTITVNTDAITLTSTDAANNEILALVHGETGNFSAMSITNASAYPAIQITGSSTGDDITGTSGLWTVSEAGAGTFASVTLGATGLVLQNSETITNGTNNGITFDSDTSTVEDFTINLGANTNIITFSSASGATTVDWGSMTTASGMTTITGDAADFTIGSTGNSDGEDVIITQAGVGDNSVEINSAGSGADAIKINATVAGIDIDSIADMAITNTAATDADDFVITQTGTHDSSLILQSAGTGGDAISLITSNAAGDIKIASGDAIDIDAVDMINIDISGAAKDFDVDSAAGSVSLDGGEAAADAIVIIASATAGGIDVDSGTGGIAVDTTGVFSIDGAAASNVSVVSGATDENLTISVTGATASSLILSSAGTGDDAVDLNATAGGLDVDTAKSIVLTSTENEVDAIVIQATLGGIDIICDAASATEDIDIANTGGSVNINSSEAADLAVYLSTSNAAGQIAINSADVTADGIEIDSAGGIEIDAAGAGDDIRIDAAAASVYIEGAEADSQAIQIDASNAAGGMDLDCGSGGFNLLATAGDLTISNTGAKDIVIDAQAGRVLITGTESAADAIILTADGVAGEISLNANTGGLDLNAASGDITIDTTGAITDEIKLTNATGTAAGAIALLASAGGISAEVADEKAVYIGNDAATTFVKVSPSATPASELIAVTNEVGTADTAIALTATAGGITAKVADGKNLILGNAASDAHVTVAAHGTAGSEDVRIINTNGTDAKAIEILASAGGIAAEVADEKAVYIGNDAATTFVKVSPSATPASELIAVTNAAGTADTAIALTSTAGGITAKVADEKNLILGNAASDAHVTIAASATAGNEDVRIVNTNGTNAKAIEILASAGGVAIEVADEKEAYMGNDGADSYFKVAPSATPASEIVSVVNSAGTANGAIVITSTAGGVDINAKEMFTIDVAAGTAATADITIQNTVGTDVAAIALTTTTGGIDINAKEMLTLDVAAGTAATADIIITNTPGTDEAAIAIQAVAGGIDIDTAITKNFAVNAGQILIESEQNVASAISMITDTGSTESIVVTNTQGEAAASIGITATAGGITVTSAKAFKLETAVTLNDVQTISQNDETPDVGGYSYFNTGTNADTIDDFDGTNIEEGQIIVVVSKAVITYDADSGALICGTTDIVTGAGDATTWLYDGTNWLLIGWINQSSNLNIGNAE